MKVDFLPRELEVVVSALTRLKFDDPAQEPFFGSPLLGAAHDRMLDALISELRDSGDLERAKRWVAWREWKNRSHEKELVRKYASSSPVWATWSHDEKIDFLRTCCSPFLPSSEELEELCQEIDAGSFE